MRKGLSLIESTPKQKPYRMKPRDMSLKPGFSIDNIQELLSHIEGEDFK
jgi:hypothetical protein